MRLAAKMKRALEHRGPRPCAVADASHLDVGAADVPTEDAIRRAGHAVHRRDAYGSAETMRPAAVNRTRRRAGSGAGRTPAQPASARAATLSWWARRTPGYAGARRGFTSMTGSSPPV